MTLSQPECTVSCCQSGRNKVLQWDFRSSITIMIYNVRDCQYFLNILFRSNRLLTIMTRYGFPGLNMIQVFLNAVGDGGCGCLNIVSRISAQPASNVSACFSFSPSWFPSCLWHISHGKLFYIHTANVLWCHVLQRCAGGRTQICQQWRSRRLLYDILLMPRRYSKYVEQMGFTVARCW